MDFVDIIDNLPDHRHVMNKINAARQLDNNQGQQDNTCKIFARNIILASFLMYLISNIYIPVNI